MSTVQLQFYVLLAGTAFAWYNFVFEYINWTKGKKCKTGCPVSYKSPFLSPCFGGAVFFTIAFLLNLYI